MYIELRFDFKKTSTHFIRVSTVGEFAKKHLWIILQVESGTLHH